MAKGETHTFVCIVPPEPIRRLEVAFCAIKEVIKMNPDKCLANHVHMDGPPNISEVKVNRNVRRMLWKKVTRLTLKTNFIGRFYEKRKLDPA